jgi:hypothetical protein
MLTISGSTGSEGSTAITQKPADIRKWEESKVHKLIEKLFPKVKADKMLSDLSSIALKWAKSYVRQRQTFKTNAKGENMAPLAFQSDPDGTYHGLAVQLRNLEVEDVDKEDGAFPIVESVDAPEETPSRTAKEKPPGRSSGTSLLRPTTPARLE